MLLRHASLILAMLGLCAGAQAAIVPPAHATPDIGSR
jgi:hypothetical protein